MAMTPTLPGRPAPGRPGRRAAPSMTEAELRAYFMARETLRRLKPRPWPCFAADAAARPPGAVAAR